MRTKRAPHIGEYATKTNAVRDHPQIKDALEIKPMPGHLDG
jgi:hypothetical protein